MTIHRQPDHGHQMDAIFEANEHYFSIADSVCGETRNNCQIFTNEGLLVAPDGAHLSEAGALEVSQRIRSTLLRLREE